MSATTTSETTKDDDPSPQPDPSSSSDNKNSHHQIEQQQEHKEIDDEEVRRSGIRQEERISGTASSEKKDANDPTDILNNGGGIGVEKEDVEEDDDIEIVVVDDDEMDDEDSDDEDDSNDGENDDSDDNTNDIALASRTVVEGYKILLHILCLALYLIPILVTVPNNSGAGDSGNPLSIAVLDELHIVSRDNHDINGDSTTLERIFTNDYWGRPMNSTSSHKSWRPLSVLSFRYFKGGAVFPELFSHRLFNVLTHAAIADLLGILAVQLLPAMHDECPETCLLLQIITKCIFAFHPTHVEVTANAANRPHLLALLCSLLLTQPNLSIWIFVPTLLAGYLVCETFLFQIVPVAVTLVCLSYIQRYHGPHQTRQRPPIWRQILGVTMSCSSSSPVLFWKLLFLTVSAFAYYALRLHMDWLSIPDGLIRPAENPFFTLKGWTRFYSYTYVIAIHIAKAWDLDFIGPSHEYGFACIPPITVAANSSGTPQDARCLIFASMVFALTLWLFYCLWRQRRQSVLSMSILLTLFTVSWFVPSLVPISGIIKVGTFVSDRIVVASTVAVAVLVGQACTYWICYRPTILSKVKTSKDAVAAAAAAAAAESRKRNKLYVLAFVFLGITARRVYLRTTEWMDSKTLLESSLRTCPRFAKAHLESSKLYSGLYPQFFNLTTARYHLNQVEDIDPDFCDVHYQFAHVAVQEHKYLEFEERLTLALMCPYTMGQAMPMWHNYWKIAISDAGGGTPLQQAAAKERYEKALKRINAAVEEEDRKERQRLEKEAASAATAKQKKGPLVLEFWKSY